MDRCCRDCSRTPGANQRRGVPDVLRRAHRGAIPEARAGPRRSERAERYGLVATEEATWTQERSRGSRPPWTGRGILAVTFDRPETMNASTIGMKRDLVELLTQAQMDDAVRVVVFTGTGRAFWAGDDMKSYGATGRRGHGADRRRPPQRRSAPTTTLRAISQAVNVAVRDLDKLTIAAINGFAIQTGFSLALACDFRIAARSARAGQRHAALRAAAGRGRPVAARAAPRRGRDDGLPDAQAHRRRRRGARARAGARGGRR